MSKQLLINLPVHNIEIAKKFFADLDLSLNKKLSDENATCFNIEDNIIVALLPWEHFKQIINGNSVADEKINETLLAIGLESKEEVIALLDKAVAAGAHEVHERVDAPDIFAGTFKDLDGHLWNIFHMR